MTLQAIGSGAKIVGNALVPNYNLVHPHLRTNDSDLTRIPSVVTIVAGVAIAALGICFIALASSGTVPTWLFKAGTTAARLMNGGIFLTAAGGGLMVAPCILNAGANVVKAVKDYREPYVFSEGAPPKSSSAVLPNPKTPAEALSKDDPGYRSEY